MRLTVVVGLLCVVAGGFYGKLLFDRDVAEERAARALADRPRIGDPPPTPPPPPPAPVVRPVAPPKKTPEPEKPAALLPSEERTLARARELILAGRFDEAEKVARDAAIGGSRAIETAGTQLAEKARLFAVLTRAIEPHPFAKAVDLVEVTLVSGVVHVARVLAETDSNVVLALSDGRQIEVRPERIAKRAKLAPDAWAARARAEIEKKRGELADAGALEVYHLGCAAFEAALPDLGVPLLERALALPGGGAIVDVYGSGDLEALHRAQERIRHDAGAPSPAEAVAEAPRRPRPRPMPVAVPTPPPPPRPEKQVSETPPPVEVPPDEQHPAPPAPPAPSPEMPPAPPQGPGTDEPPQPPAEPADGLNELERLERDAHWLAAHEAYKQGVDAYRVSFAGSSTRHKEGIRRARALLEDARKELDQVPELSGDAAGTWDAFSARVNALLRDVKKRQAATGS